MNFLRALDIRRNVLEFQIIAQQYNSKECFELGMYSLYLLQVMYFIQYKFYVIT